MLLLLKAKNMSGKTRGVDEGQYNLKYGHQYSIVMMSYKFPEVESSLHSDSRVCDTS